MITIVDYGMGNIGSMLNMFRRIGVQANFESDPERLRNASKLVLPGVGSFDNAMQRIRSTPGLLEILEHKALTECVPILGVCLGMQLFMRASEEGNLSGLGWIDGEAKRFPTMEGLKVPHMGWNTALPNEPSALTTDLAVESKYYFVHSYYVTVDEGRHSIMRTQYGVEFDSAIGSDNIFGVQFHPEKSHKFGMSILKKFSTL